MTDTITTILLSFAVFCMAATVILRLFRHILTLQKNIKLLIEANRMELIILQYLGKATVCNLWKIRQEIYNWQCQWAERDEFEAANQAKMIIEDIEKQIELISKTIEDDKNKDN